MGLGIVAIVALLWLRLGPSSPPLPQEMTLPMDEEAEAVTQTSTRTIVLTKSGLVLVYDRAGALQQTVRLAE